MNKYGAKKVTAPDGQKFDSRREYRRYCELKLLERAGKISALRRQVKYEIFPKQVGESALNYIADFVYIEDGKEVVEDCKGYKTDLYIAKRKAMLFLKGIRIRET